MALDKQTITIPFGQGLDTKTDPRQLPPGKLLLLKDAYFVETNKLGKRPGTESIAILSSSGYGIASFKKELITLTTDQLGSYNDSSGDVLSKDLFSPANISASSIIKDTNAQTYQDSAYNANGNLYLFTYVDSSLGSCFVVIDGATEQQIVKGTLGANFIRPRAFSLGNYLIIIAVDVSTSPQNLSLFSILITNPTISVGVPIVSNVNSANPKFDGVVSDDTLYLSWNGDDSPSSIRTALIDSGLVLQNQTTQLSESAYGCISIFADEQTSPPSIWTVYFDGTRIRYFIQNGGNLGNILAPTTFLNETRGIVNVAGYAVNGQGHFYFQKLNTYPYQINSKNVRSDYLSYASANNAGVVGSSAVFLRSVGLASKVALFNNQPHFLTSYGPINVGSTTANQGFEPTYFVVKAATSGTRAEIIGKLAYSNAGGYSSSSILTSFNKISDSQYQLSYLIKDLVASQAPQWNISGGVYFQLPGAPLYSQTGINSAKVDLYSPSSFSAVEMGDNLNINGGQLWTYDGKNVVENNFHLYPEDMVATVASSANGITAGLYSYISIYEWTDNQGNIHRSAPSLPCSVEVTEGTSAQVQLRIPTLRLTNKSNVSIVTYRTTPSINNAIYTALNVPQAPLMSSTAIDSTIFTDFVPDSQLNGNSLLYTTGDIVENIGPPAFSFVGKYGNRVMGLSAENRNLWWFSKEVLLETPVEMSDLFTLYVPPKFGECTCGIEMDDKWIIFHENAIQYITGRGPDDTGSQNDFSEPIFITSTVGTKYPKSVVLTHNGVMFKSDKGIWLLDRSLNVSYVGSDVEAYNQYEITSATVIPNSTLIFFGLGNSRKTVLVYDYYYEQWGIFTGWNVISAGIHNKLYTYIEPGSSPRIQQETPGIYSDNGRPILMGVKTSWLSLSGLQGFQRAYRMYFMGDFLTPHVLNASIAYDFNPCVAQTAQMKPLPNKKYGGDTWYGSGAIYGGDKTFEQYRMNFKKQKCQSIQITLEESLDPNNYQLGAGLSLEAILVVFGQKLGYPKLADSKTVT